MQKNTRCLYNIIIKQNRKLHSRIWRQIAWWDDSGADKVTVLWFIIKDIHTSDDGHTCDSQWPKHPAMEEFGYKYILPCLSSDKSRFLRHFKLLKHMLKISRCWIKTKLLFPFFKTVIRLEAECFLEKLIISETEHLTEHRKQFNFRVKCDSWVSTAIWREESCKQQKECYCQSLRSYSKMYTSFLCCQHSQFVLSVSLINCSKIFYSNVTAVFIFTPCIIIWYHNYQLFNSKHSFQKQWDHFHVNIYWFNHN